MSKIKIKVKPDSIIDLGVSIAMLKVSALTMLRVLEGVGLNTGSEVKRVDDALEEIDKYMDELLSEYHKAMKTSD